MEKLYTVKSAATIIGYHPQSVYDFLRDGLLEGFRNSSKGHWRISEAHIAAFLSGHGAAPQSSDS
jgi:hypothetical protein